MLSRPRGFSAPIALVCLAACGGAGGLGGSSASSLVDAQARADALPPMTERSPYTYQFEGLGGETTFDIVAGRAPWGLLLEGDGRLHGTPTFAGVFDFTVRAQSGGERVDTSYRVAVGRWQTIIEVPCGGSTTIDLDASARSEHTGLDLDAAGAVAYFSVPVPPDIAAVDLSLTANSGDPILLLPRTSYGPGAPEVYAYTLIEDHPGDEALRLTDGTPHYGLAGYREDGRVPVTVAAAEAGSFELSVACQTGLALGPEWLPNAAVGAGYATELSVWLGTPPFTFAAEALPPGLTIDAEAGIISGVATAAGAYVAAVTVSDSLGASETRQLPIDVVEPAVLSCGQTVQGSFDARAFDGARGLATAGGAMAYAISVGPQVTTAQVVGRAVEGGFTLGLWQGALGRPVGGSRFADYQRVRYDEGAGATLEWGDDRLPVIWDFDGLLPFTAAAVGGVGAYELSVSCGDTLALAPRFLPHPDVGEAYAQQLVARGDGAQAAAFSVEPPGLPAGLTLDAQSGIVSGEAEQGGAATITLTATSGEAQASRTYTLAAGEGGCGGAEALTCGDFIYDTLEGVAWANRVSVDLSVDAGARFYCVDVRGASSVTVNLAPVSGSNPDLFVGGPGLAPGSTALEDYAAWSTQDGDDALSLGPWSWPGLPESGPLAVAVAARRAGGYTLEVRCE